LIAARRQKERDQLIVARQTSLGLQLKRHGRAS
jgi:hypothetical protein